MYSPCTFHISEETIPMTNKIHVANCFFYEMVKLFFEWKTSHVESKDFRVGPVPDIDCAEELIVCSDEIYAKIKAYVDLSAKYISNSRANIQGNNTQLLSDILQIEIGVVAEALNKWDIIWSFYPVPTTEIITLSVRGLDCHLQVEISWFYLCLGFVLYDISILPLWQILLKLLSVLRYRSFHETRQLELYQQMRLNVHLRGLPVQQFFLISNYWHDSFTSLPFRHYKQDLPQRETTAIDLDTGPADRFTKKVNSLWKWASFSNFITFCKLIHLFGEPKVFH